MRFPLRRLLLASLAIVPLVAVSRDAHDVGGGSPQASYPAARVADAAFPSRALQASIPFRVYLPAAYRRDGPARYPVIYMLHGLPGDEESYRGIDVQAIGRIAERAGRPAIVVAPQGARQGDSDPEWLDRGDGRGWMTAISQELVSYVDGHYRSIADRRGRAIIGISAGGYGAAIIAARHPDTYSLAQSWSGYFHPTNPEGSEPLDLGSAQANAEADVHAYVGTAGRTLTRYPTTIGFFVGDRDPHFVAENRQLHEELVEAGIPHQYAVYPGAHMTAFWEAHQDAWITAAATQLAGR